MATQRKPARRRPKATKAASPAKAARKPPAKARPAKPAAKSAAKGMAVRTKPAPKSAPKSAPKPAPKPAARPTASAPPARGLVKGGATPKLKTVQRPAPVVHFPAFGWNSQHNYDSALGGRMGAHMLNLFVQRRFGNFAPIDVDDKAAIVTHKTNIEALFKLVPLATDHDAISIAVRLGTGDNGLNPGRADAPDALKEVGDLFTLYFKLGRVIEMLVLPPATERQSRDIVRLRVPARLEPLEPTWPAQNSS